MTKIPRRLQERILAIVRSRILAANVAFDDIDPTDDIAMMDPQERTDAIMAALFKKGVTHGA